jgi:hypothetical protein
LHCALSMSSCVLGMMLPFKLDWSLKGISVRSVPDRRDSRDQSGAWNYLVTAELCWRLSIEEARMSTNKPPPDGHGAVKKRSQIETQTMGEKHFPSAIRTLAASCSRRRIHVNSKTSEKSSNAESRM